MALKFVMSLILLASSALQTIYQVPRPKPSVLRSSGKWVEFESIGALPDEFPFNTTELSPFNPKIHTMGNVGILGKLHAESSALFTNAIDVLTHGGRNIRREMAQHLAQEIDVSLEIIDVGCGAGTFTKELCDAGFSDVAGMDASPEMLSFAKRNLPDCRFICGNAGLEMPEADCITCSFVMHELPAVARKDIMSQAHKSLPLGGKLIIIDIEKSYLPIDMMLQGEPYIKDYLETFADSVKEFPGYRTSKKTWIAGTLGMVGLWTLEKLPV